MAVWRRRKRQVSDSSGPGGGAKKDRLRGPRGTAAHARDLGGSRADVGIGEARAPRRDDGPHWSGTRVQCGGSAECARDSQR